MECAVCQRPASAGLLFNCTSCARNTLYIPRIQQARLLLETESLGQELERNIGDASKSEEISQSGSKVSQAHPTFAIERATAERVVLAEQTEKIMAQVEVLRSQNQEMKSYLAKQRAEYSQRRLKLEAAKSDLAHRQNVDFEPILKSIKRTQSHWDALHAKTAESRTFLCREAAHLYGLQQRKRKRGVAGRDMHYVGGLPIPDLRELNNASPAQVSASITNLARLVHLTSHYLSLRLPAEITLPHRDYPLPTIFSPGSSYNAREVPYPGFTPTHSSNNSPSASRVADTRSLPRPRPLHTEKKLAVLAKEEPLAYASFVEGITLLAWDVAWLCKSQGLDVGKTSWEDVCAMGRNLWQLLLGPSSAPRKQIPTSKDTFKAITSPESKEGTRMPSVFMLGHFSHGTAHSLLAAAEGLEYMSGWRLQSPVKVIDRVKAMLQSERDGAEWQLLEENEWEEAEAPNEPADDDEAEAQSAATKEAKSNDVESEENPVGNAARRDEESEGRTKGTSGWTKLKSRGTL